MAHLLVCDDSSFSRKMLGKVLKNMGHDFEEVGGGQAALDALNANPHKYDCLMLDLLMPEVDGFQVLEALQNRGVKTPVIVCSADVQDSARQKVMELGAIDLVNKPCKEPALSAAFEKALGKREAA